MLVHIDLEDSRQLLSAEHSFMSLQLTPLPEKPALQRHVKEPTLSVQLPPVDAQLCVAVVHSFKLAQMTPEPV